MNDPMNESMISIKIDFYSFTFFSQLIAINKVKK